MNILDYEAVKEHINILNVAYHINLEIIKQNGAEAKVICPFCGYKKLSKQPTMSLNIRSNKYHCFSCGKGGYALGLYAKFMNISNDRALKELLEKECYSLDKSKFEITPVNQLEETEMRDRVYRAFLNMLKLEPSHKKELKDLGFLDSSITEGLYKSVPKNYIKRRLIGSALSRKFNLCGIPGFFQEEDFKWTFSRCDGFFVPVYNEHGQIQGLSIHLDKEFNGNKDIWFSSNNKVNGTGARSWIMKNNITEDSETVVVTDNFLLGNLIKETINSPMIAFQNFTNSYTILSKIENTNIRNILFVIRLPNANQNLDYIINCIFSDLITLKYNLDIKYISNYKDFFDDKFNETYSLKKVA